MPMTFKVVETFVLPDGSTPDDLAESIQIVADAPFSLHWVKGSNPSVTIVKLHRHTEDAPQPEELQESDGKGAPDA